MQHIETVTVGAGGAASITFMAVGDIPSDYTDLLVVLSGRSTASVVIENGRLFLNGSSANFTVRRLTGDGSAVSSGTHTNQFYHVWMTGASATSNSFGNVQIYIPNYRSSVAKSISSDAVTENNGTSALQNLSAGLWNVTNPITSITLQPETGSFVQYSSASLYGILAGSDGIVSVS